MGGNIPNNLKPIFAAAGRQYGIPPAVLAGLSSVESNLGRNRGPSSAGAVGLMQFLPSTARGLGINPYDDRSAIFGTAKYLVQLGYHSNPLRALGAYNGGPGNPQYSYANQVMAESRRLGGQLGGVSVSGAGMMPPSNPRQGKGGGLFTPTTSQTVSGGGVDWQAAGIAALEKEASTPINSSGKLHNFNPLADLASAASSGLYNTPVSINTSTTVSRVGGGSAVSGNLRAGTFHGGIGSGDVNPLAHGWSLGRTDMGVDANARVGTPILAMNASKVVQIVPNWFNGQPLVLMQLLAGPNRGKYWYVAEQVSSIPRVGQIVPRGGTVARYASSGTGIEIGWGSPSTNSRTAAGPSYHEGMVTSQGTDFRRRVLHA